MCEGRRFRRNGRQGRGLAARAVNKLFSLAALYDANKELLKPVAEREDHSHNELVKTAIDYWSTVAKAMPDWLKVKKGDMRPLDLRQENISSHAVVLRALGATGASLMKENPSDWKARLLDLTSVNWSKSNPHWENICIVANSVVSNRQARLADTGLREAASWRDPQ